MKADPAAQLRLLDVQDLDTRVDALRHQRSTLPQLARLRELDEELGRVDGAVRDLRIATDDLAAEQRRADADVEQVKTRKQRDQGMVDSGAIGDPKALARMLDELVSLDRRITDLEDVELEVMERLETAQQQLDERGRELDALRVERAQVATEIEERTAAIDADLAEAEQARTAEAVGLPDDLAALYERIRAHKGGVGAAALRRRECGGCRLTLNASDLALIARTPADDVVRCEECGRILVRTDESGLPA